jgi:hypothetical protein
MNLDLYYVIDVKKLRAHRKSLSPGRRKHAQNLVLCRLTVLASKFTVYGSKFLVEISTLFGKTSAKFVQYVKETRAQEACAKQEAACSWCSDDISISLPTAIQSYRRRARTHTRSFSGYLDDHSTYYRVPTL